MSSRRPHVVLRSIVGPALGLSAGALIAAGAVSGCASSTNTQPTPQPTATEELWVGTVATPERDPEPTPSASATPSAAPSEIPKPGDIAPVGQVPAKPGVVAPPKVGTVSAPEEQEPRVGIVNSPGFGGGAAPVRAPRKRPTRVTRHVTDADASRARPLGIARSLV